MNHLMRFVLPTLLWCAGCAAQRPIDHRLLVCGADEVFIVDASRASPEKEWTWRAQVQAGLPEDIQKLFRSTDDCKPRGDRILISSSGGACAVVEFPTGKVLWYARVPNAHSIELLPRDRIIAAASTHAQGNRLMLFSLRAPDEVIWDTSLVSAHGVVWDQKHQRLWALGLKELRSYTLKDWKTDKPSLELEQEYPLPDENGHDLLAIAGSDDLTVTTGRHVYLFDRTKREFRTQSDVPDQEHVKSFNVHPLNGRVAYTHGSDRHWWTDTIHLLHPKQDVTLKGRRMYKVRWLTPD